MSERKDYTDAKSSILSIMDTGGHLFRGNEIPLSILTIRDRLIKIKSENKRLLIMKKLYLEPENLVVVTMDKFYPRFVLCHYTNSLGTKIPYTLSYFTFLDKNSKYVIKVENES